MKHHLLKGLHCFAVILVISLSPHASKSQAYGFLSSQHPRRATKEESKIELKEAILELKVKYKVDIIFEEKLLEGITIKDGLINFQKDFDHNIRALLDHSGLNYRRLKENKSMPCGAGPSTTIKE